MIIKVLYFASLRESLGIAEESIQLEGATVSALLEQLRSRGPVWAQQLSPEQNYRFAVNQVMADFATAIRADDEVAFFPPVTGG